MDVAAEIVSVRSELPENVKLVAVSKFHSPDSIMEAYNAGQRIFAESRPQELAAKAAQLPKDIEWHFIGHLQSNKIKMVVPCTVLIHSVNSEKLLNEIDSYSSKNGYHSNCLLEMHIAKESTKQGFSFDEIHSLLDRLKSSPLKSTTLCGVMGMATFTDDENEVSSEFAYLADSFRKLKDSHPELLPAFKEISMGMTEDYRIAIKEGSTMVRIGTKIFGPRQY